MLKRKLWSKPPGRPDPPDFASPLPLSAVKKRDQETQVSCAEQCPHSRLATSFLLASSSQIERRHKDNLAAHLSSKGAASGTSAEEYQKYAERLILASAQGDVEGVLLCLSKSVNVTTSTTKRRCIGPPRTATRISRSCCSNGGAASRARTSTARRHCTTWRRAGTPRLWRFY